MQTRNSTARRRGSGKYQPQPDLTPLYGVRLFASENGFVMAGVAMLIYTAARLIMCIIEQKNASSFDIISLFGILAALLLGAGALTVMLATGIKSISGVVLFFGILILLLSDAIFCFTLAFDTISETSLLGVVQSVLEILLLLCLIVILCVLLVSCLNRRTSPGIGHISSGVALLATALTAFRTVSTFASLVSALGANFSWDNAAGLHSELQWVMRTVKTSSDYAPDMFYARLFERIALIIMLCSMLPLIFRFAAFFKQYNMQMEISAELPGRRNVREQRGIPYSTGHFDLLSSFHSLREHERVHAQEPDEDEQEQEDPLPLVGYHTPDYISGLDEPEEPFFLPSPEPLPPEPLPDEPEELEDDDLGAMDNEPEAAAETPSEPEPPAIPVVYNTNPLDPNYGLPVEQPETDDSSAPGSEPAPSRVKVKPRQTIPSPNDPSIWFHYSDDEQ